MNQDEQLEVRGARKRRVFHMAAEIVSAHNG